MITMKLKVLHPNRYKIKCLNHFLYSQPCCATVMLCNIWELGGVTWVTLKLTHMEVSPPQIQTNRWQCLSGGGKVGMEEEEQGLLSEDPANRQIGNCQPNRREGLRKRINQLNGNIASPAYGQNKVQQPVTDIEVPSNSQNRKKT